MEDMCRDIGTSELLNGKKNHEKENLTEEESAVIVAEDRFEVSTGLQQ